jgi:uncharacterized protein (DUF2252 family)
MTTFKLMDEAVTVWYLHRRKEPTINKVTLNVSREITVNKASSATVISARKQIISELQDTHHKGHNFMTATYRA